MQEEAALAAALAQLDELRRQTDLDQRENEIQVRLAKATLERAQAGIPVASLISQLALAEERVHDATITAPIDGTILNVMAHPGELVGGDRPIVTMGDTSRMRAVAEVYETDIGRVRLGQSAIVTSRALEHPLTGKVVEIGRMIFKNDVLNVDPGGARRRAGGRGAHRARRAGARRRAHQSHRRRPDQRRRGASRRRWLRRGRRRVKRLVAWRLLTYEKGRSALAVAGIFVAVLMIFLQLGFYSSVPDGGMLVYDKMRFDLMLTSSEYYFQGQSFDFPRARLYQALALPEVAIRCAGLSGRSGMAQPGDGLAPRCRS